MAYYISVTSFNKEKNNQGWKSLFDGSFVEKAKEDIAKIDKEIDELYNNPQVDLDFALQQRDNYLKEFRSTLSGIIRDFEELKKTDKSDTQLITERIGSLNDSLINFLGGPSFFDPRQPFHDFFSSLFQAILNVDVEGDWQDDLSKLPTDSWIQLYKKIEAENVKEAIKQLGENPDDEETIKYYFGLVKEIKTILKHCIENNSEIFISDELNKTENELPEKEIVDEIFEKYFK